MKGTFPRFILIATVALAGCCISPKEFHHAIPLPAYSLIPHNSSSTLQMRDSSGAVATFRYVSGAITEETLDCGNCCGANVYQHFLLNLRCDSLDMDVNLDLMGQGSGPSSARDGATLMVGFDDISAFFVPYYPVSQGDVCSAGAELQCIYNIAVGSTTYDTLYQFDRPIFLLQNLPERTVTSIWYSPRAGLVKVQMANGQSWELAS